MAAPYTKRAAPENAGSGSQKIDLLGGSRLADIQSAQRNQPPAEPRALRLYQKQDIDRIKAAFDNGAQKVMYQAPAGSGKMLVGSSLLAEELKQGRRCAFIVPYLTLIDQALEAFLRKGIPLEEIGVVQEDHPIAWRSKARKICSAQTLARRGTRPAVAIIDEAHRDYAYLRQARERFQQSLTPAARSAFEQQQARAS